MGNNNLNHNNENCEKTLSKCDMNNIESKYIIQQIFDILHRGKFLEIIKYKKKVQERLNIKIKDFKECSEIYSSIEIEIIPNKIEYQRFININKKEEEKYYHIYFNDTKEEIKRNNIFLCKKDKVSKIRIKIDYQIISFYKLFNNCLNIESIKFKKFYRNNIINMGYMFNRCLLLKEINISNFNTNNVNNMKSMFSE